MLDRQCNPMPCNAMPTCWIRKAQHAQARQVCKRDTLGEEKEWGRNGKEVTINGIFEKKSLEHEAKRIRKEKRTVPRKKEKRNETK